MVPEVQFSSYYGRPVIKEPVWQAPDVAGYLFFGGLAGASSVLAASAHLSGHRELARVAKVGALGAISLSAAALVHDLGRPARFFNMLRVFKPSSPMSVGSWLLSGFVPAATLAAVAEVTGGPGWLGPLGGFATVGAAALGAPVATYTAALISDTAVPAWHDGYEDMPFVFVASAASAAAGLGLLSAPVAETRPLAGLGAVAAAVEIGLSKRMEKRTGPAEETFHEGKAGRYMKAAQALSLGGAALAATSGRSRLRSALAGAALLAGSAAERFGIFEAGIASAVDPKYTVAPQRRRLEERGER